MKPYLLALGAGLLVGIIYSILNVRSPAPPVVALVGLFGILVGEQITPVVKRWLGGEDTTLARLSEDCSKQMFGSLPVDSRDTADRA